jgi:adenine-specific DNA-methyltransferase
MGNYHVWETLIRWDEPETYGIANKRVQCKQYKSDFNSKRRIHEGLREVLRAVRCRHLLVSFNNEGYVGREEMVGLLSEKGHVGVVSVDFKRYVGAQIGIHDLNGRKVGRVSHLRNKEYLFVVSERQETVDAVVTVLEASIANASLASSETKRKRESHGSERPVEG